VLLLAVFGFRAFPEKDVTVLSNGQAFRVSATFDAQSEGLSAADVYLDAGDKVLYSPGDHASVAVQRARDVTISIDGQQIDLRSQASTVGGALAEAGQELHPGDSLTVDGQSATERAPLVAAALAARPVGYALPGGASAPGAAVRIAVARSRPAAVMIDTLRVETSSSAATVQGLLEDLGMTVREGDLVQPSLTTPLTAGMTVRLAKARTISVVLDGKEQSLYTQAQTVADVVRVMGLDPASLDTVSLPADAPVQNGMTLTIGRTVVTEEDQRDPIAPTTTYETDPTLPAGEVRIVNGVEGVQLSRYRVTYKNGQLVDPKILLSTSVAQAPVPTRHIDGTKVVPGARPTLNAPGYSGPYVRKMNVMSTWYNAAGGVWERGDPNWGRTATGVMVDIGVCAVDPNVIPLGTRFYVDGYGPCVAADTGGLIKGNIIDLGYPETAGDPGWGKHPVDIYILD
jgi:uncharacterized protein YabE (DUF348 family)/3D (Asp-Asp-Asp) domain-containing protein